jgi:hypothetical protein
MIGLVRKGAIGAGAVLLAVGLAACGGSSGRTAAHAQPAAATSPPTTQGPKPYDPKKPINLGGEPGVTPAEQHRAESLLRRTITDLKKYQTPNLAILAGYRSIGDGITGDEHFVKWSYVNDGHILDPNRPESLVYEMIDGKQQVAAAMYMMPLGTRFSGVPNVGGPLTQWHVHDNLCLTNDPTQKTLAGFTVTAHGVCPPGTSKAGNTPMLHVWVVKNSCGPFAALEGIGAGQVPAGQTRLCDTGHGSVGATTG